MSTEHTRLLVEDPDRLARDCARAAHPAWGPSGGCWCGEVDDEPTRRTQVLQQLVEVREPRRTIGLRILGRGRR